jgi:hypothetical protein
VKVWAVVEAGQELWMGLKMVYALRVHVRRCTVSGGSAPDRRNFMTMRPIDAEKKMAKQQLLYYETERRE